MQFKQHFINLKKTRPLIHCITNYVTANDCANILLAAGASPIMADEPEETAEITSISQGLCINLGTLNSNSIRTMSISGRKANELGIPVILDPTGAGASELRTRTARQLTETVRFTAIRGNVSEIKALCTGTGSTKGVDADSADIISPALIKDLAKKTGAVITVSGATDIITDADRTMLIRNGHPLMGKITGTGCMSSVLIAAFLSSKTESPFDAVCAAVIAMGLAGEKAASMMKEQDGNASFRTHLIDAVYNMMPEELDKGARYELN